MKKGRQLTICVGNIDGVLEYGDDDNAHDHHEPINDRNINLTHLPVRGMDYLQPGKALERHRLFDT